MICDVLVDCSLVDGWALTIANEKLHSDTRNAIDDDIKPSRARWVHFAARRTSDAESVAVVRKLRLEIDKPRVGMYGMRHKAEVHERHFS